MIRQYKWVMFISTCLPLWAATQQGPPQQQFYTATGAYSHSHTDLFSAMQQTAAIAGISNPAIGFTGVRPYGMPGINQYQLAAVYPVSSGSFGFKAFTRGGGGFTTSMAGLTYARKFGPGLSAGLSFTYNSIKIAGYGMVAVPSAEAGVLFHITRDLHAGLQLRNPVSQEWGIDKQEKLPLVYVTGFGYEPSRVFYCSAEFIKEEEQPMEVAISFQYKPADRFLVKAGLFTGTSQVWGGAGFQFSRCRFDLFVSWHPQLGFTPGTGILFQFKKQTHEQDQ